MKQCGKCGEVKPLSDFHINRHRCDGRQSWCKTCARARELYRERRDYKRVRKFRSSLLNDRGWLEQKYRKELRTLHEIADVVGCSPETIGIALQTHGIQTIPHMFRNVVRSRPDWEEVEI